MKARGKGGAGGKGLPYAPAVENRREGGRVVRRTAFNIGRVTEGQAPFLKAAWSEMRPGLVWDE